MLDGGDGKVSPHGVGPHGMSPLPSFAASGDNDGSGAGGGTSTTGYGAPAIRTNIQSVNPPNLGRVHRQLANACPDSRAKSTSAGVDEDSSRPGVERERVTEPRQLPPDRHQRLGDGVAGVGLVAEDRHGRPLHRLDPPGDQRRERVDVAGLGPPDERGIQSSLPSDLS